MSRKLLIVISIITILVFNLSAFGDTVSNLLAEGIYAEETKGDLDEAMTIYKKIIDENTGNSANIAEAHYRLGTCYLKTGDDTKAIEMFKELLTDFRDHEEIASDARAQLVKLNALDVEGQINMPLELGPVPWEAGETCWYDTKTPTGAVSGRMILSVKDITVDGNEMWRIEYYTASPISVSQSYNRVDILKENFTSVSSIYKIRSQSIRADMMAKYEKGNIRFITESNNKKDERDIPVEGNALSNSGQQYYILRLLPITANYNTSVNIFFAPFGRVIKTQIKSAGRETVKVPAGTFDCYCVELEFSPNSKTKIWISDDDKKDIVKIEMPDSSTTELEKVIRDAADESREFRDPKTGISMTPPTGWHIANSSMLPDTPIKMLALILSPELKSELYATVAPGAALPKQQDISKAMEALKAVYKNNTLRPESFVYGKINGLPSLTHISDFDRDGKKMVYYRVYILNKQEICIFELIVEKENFYEIKPEVDSIAKSVKWNKNFFGF